VFNGEPITPQPKGGLGGEEQKNQGPVGGDELGGRGPGLGPDWGARIIKKRSLKGKKGGLERALAGANDNGGAEKTVDPPQTFAGGHTKKFPGSNNKNQ